MSKLWLPPETDLAQAARGWPAPGIRAYGTSASTLDINPVWLGRGLTHLLTPTQGHLAQLKGNYGTPQKQYPNLSGGFEASSSYWAGGTGYRVTQGVPVWHRSGRSNIDLDGLNAAQDITLVVSVLRNADTVNNRISQVIGYEGDNGGLLSYSGYNDDGGWQNMSMFDSNWASRDFLAKDGVVDTALTFNTHSVEAKTNEWCAYVAVGTKNVGDLELWAQDTASEHAFIEIGLVAVFDRKLTQSEAKAISLSPIGELFQPANQAPFLVGLTGGAGGSTDNLTATDVSSTSEVDSPAITQVHALTAADIESASSVSSPAITTDGTDALTPTDVSALSEVDSPAITQTHALTAADIVSLSEISSPALGGPGVDALTATDLESLSQVDAPALTQVHALTALDVESASLVDTPSMIDLGEITNAQLYAKILEIYQILGLDADNPMTVTPTSRVAGDISQTISGDGVTSTTVTRD